MPADFTTYPLQHDRYSFAEHLRDRGYPIAGLPAAPRDDADEPDDPQQAELPTGPTHVAARRSPDQLASARKFLAAAGRVKFDRGRATLKAVWMAVTYRASLGDDRKCFASLKTLSTQALVSKRTARRHLVTLAALGLIHTDNRAGGHAPTHWFISEVSPSVLGGQDVRGGRTRCPGGADKVAADISNRSTAPTERVLLASKQQPDGACAPPSAQKQKNPPPTTKKKEPTQTAEPTQALAPGKTDTGGKTRGASDKQIKYLHVLADKVGAEPAEDLWRAADPKRLQTQIKAAKAVRERGGKHTHEADEEKVLRVGIVDAIQFKDSVQRCECGAVRSACSSPAGEEGSTGPWTLSGYLVDYEYGCDTLEGPKTDQEVADDGDDLVALTTRRWAAPMTFAAGRGVV